MFDTSFYKNRRVLITGYNGFKGSWMCKMLELAGAEVIGYGLETAVSCVPALFELCNLKESVKSYIGDIRDLQNLQAVCNEASPEIVIHMAAQPIVRESYKNPVYTYDVNVMGTVNILECIRKTPSVKSFVNITTDKVYLNHEWEWGYRENENLNGYDPYSNSKSCSELVTDSYRKSFFQDRHIAISTVRAGNVIGGGDFSEDRIIPDCVRAVLAGKDIIVRNPYSVRPYQHVLEPLAVYLMIAQAQFENHRYAGSYNVGPDEADCRTTGELVTIFCDKWNEAAEGVIQWHNRHDGGPHEAAFLKLDCSRIKKVFGWKPIWDVATAIKKTVEWTRVYQRGGDVSKCMESQIREYESLLQHMNIKSKRLLDKMNYIFEDRI